MVRRILIAVMALLMAGLPFGAYAQTNMTKDDVYRTIRDNFEAHKEKFTIDMSSKTLNEIGNTDILAAAASMDDPNTSKDGDYLKVSVISWNETWKYSSLGNASITITAQYRTTLAQEKKLEDKMAASLKALDLQNKSDYQKVKAIHDYIIKQVTYDDSLTKYTAYDALVNKSAVCEGYAAAAYRMFTDAGLDSKILSGEAGGGSHVWNMVKVNGKWYNIDLTWDDTETASGKQVISYDYFLKNAKAFSDHQRDSEFTSKEFLNAYPIAAKSF